MLSQFSNEQQQQIQSYVYQIVRPMRIRFYTVLIAVVLASALGLYAYTETNNNAARHNCLAINDSRMNGNRRATAIADFLRVEEQLTQLARKTQPKPPETLAELERRQKQAEDKLIAAEQPLRLLRCPD